MWTTHDESLSPESKRAKLKTTALHLHGKREQQKANCFRIHVCPIRCAQQEGASPRSRFALAFLSDADREMNNTTTNSSNKKKRANPQVTDGADDAVEGGSGDGVAATSNGASSASSSNFRNVSACNRCRLRKNRCDQKLPACTSCEKANVKYVSHYDNAISVTNRYLRCVGFDPVSKREIPRR